MSKDTLTLTLNGDVSLALFTTALEHFNALIKALTEEVLAPDTVPIEWQIFQLKSNSAITTIRGVSQKTESPEQQLPDIEKVVQAFSVVGRALEQRQPIPYSEDVERYARALTSIINGHVNSIEFVTDDYTAYVKERVTEEELEPRKYSVGIITGIVRAISDRPRLRLSLYEDLFDRVVYCYLNQDQQELARTVWCNRVSITGLIYRDADTGRPIEVREVYNVKVLESISSGSYREARGVLPWHRGDEPAEVSIRRLRDA